MLSKSRKILIKRRIKQMETALDQGERVNPEHVRFLINEYQRVVVGFGFFARDVKAARKVRNEIRKSQ